MDTTEITPEALTGERPMVGHTPDSLIAFHDAGYREMTKRCGEGRILDIGCGVGAQTIRLRAPGRLIIGADYHPPTARFANQTQGDASTRFVAMDGAKLGFADNAFSTICSSHIIEHFVDPESHVSELARTCAPDGTALIITPNRPADFENPFHLTLFEAAELKSLLELFFHEVTIQGLEGTERLHEDFRGRRASGERLLRLDRFNLRHKLPRRFYIWGYQTVLPRVYRILGSEKSGIGSGITEDEFFMTDIINPTTPGLFAIAHRPRKTGV